MGELAYILINVIGVLLLGLLMVGAAGGFDGITESRRRRLQNKRKPSEARQKELNAFWVAEQCRINPNMKHLYSGAIFHKVDDWGYAKQRIVQIEDNL